MIYLSQLISERLNGNLNILIGKSNDINRLADRVMSLLSTKWSMKNSSRLLHPRVAHYFSLVFSDKVGEYQDERGCLTIYPGTSGDIGKMDFDNPFLAIQSILSETLELENMVFESIDLSLEEGDATTKQFLDKMLSDLVPIVDTLQTICELLKIIGDNPSGWLNLDYNISVYIKLPIAGL